MLTLINWLAAVNGPPSKLNVYVFPPPVGIPFKFFIFPRCPVHANASLIVNVTSVGAPPAPELVMVTFCGGAGQPAASFTVIVCTPGATFINIPIS